MSLDERNAELEKQLENNPIDEQIEALVAQDRRNRLNIRLLALSFGIQFLLILALAYGWSQNHKLATQAESNHNAIVRNCQTSNEARTNNKKLWDYILQIPPREPRTPEQEQTLVDFKVFVEETFKARDCNIPK